LNLNLNNNNHKANTSSLETDGRTDGRTERTMTGHGWTTAATDFPFTTGSLCQSLSLSGGSELGLWDSVSLERISKGRKKESRQASKQARESITFFSPSFHFGVLHCCTGGGTWGMGVSAVDGASPLAVARFLFSWLGQAHACRQIKWAYMDCVVHSWFSLILCCRFCLFLLLEFFWLGWFGVGGLALCCFCVGLSQVL